MKIVVLNGSPKGISSVTMQYVLYLSKRFPQHYFSILHVCQDLKKIEAEGAAFRRVIDEVASADGVLWAFPLYVMLVHSSYKRFIELIAERNAAAAFREKYAAVLSTSIRFYDHTAHNYLNAVCDDLGMRYVGGYSADMQDLLEEKERDRLALFARSFFDAIERRAPAPRNFDPLQPVRLDYRPGTPLSKVDFGARRVVVLTDARDEDANLRHMIERLQAGIMSRVEVINLNRVQIRGACLGCLQCAMENRCVFRDADDIHALYTERLMPADVLVFAGTIRDRYLSAQWKLFFDRGFFNNHVPMFPGKQIGLLVSGPLRQIANLRQMLEGYVALQPANLAGIVTDECANSAQVDGLIDGLARQLADGAAVGYIGPRNFLAVGAAKLFRDVVWKDLRVFFPCDHRYYREHGLYDFPRRSLKRRLGDGLLSLLLKLPRFRREFQRRIKTEMIKPLEKVVAATQPEEPTAVQNS